MERRRLLYRLLTLAIVLVGGSVAWYLSLQIPDMGQNAQLWGVRLPRRWWTIVGLAATGVAVLAPVALSVWESWQAAKAERAADEAATLRQTEMTGALLPVTDAIAKLSLLATRRVGNGAGVNEQRQQLQGSAKVAVISSLVTLYGGPSNARAVYYSLSGRSSKRVLTPELHHGRSPIPDRPFDEQDQDGREALAAIDANDVRQWKVGMPGPTPPGWHRGKSYQGYVSVPVAVNLPGRPRVVHGMLTLDVLYPETLSFGPDARAEQPDTRLDGETLGNFARLLAAALTMESAAPQPTQPKPASRRK